MSNFIENLKKAVETGDFNSEAAKKINEIDKLADNKVNSAEQSLEKRLEDAGTKTVIEEEAAALNSQYEKKMEELKKIDRINQQLATLVEIEDMVVASVDDMFTFIEELENKLEKEFKEENSIYGNLHQKIDEIKSKYKSIINK